MGGISPDFTLIFSTSSINVDALEPRRPALQGALGRLVCVMSFCLDTARFRNNYVD